MLLVLAIATGALVTAGFYLLLRRSLVKLLFGLVLLGHGANLLIFTLGGIVRGRAAMVPAGGTAPEADSADPLPQALVLTAIVIGFAVVAFAAVLISRTYAAVGTLDTDALREDEA